MIRYRKVGRERILNWRGVTLRWRKGRIELRTPRRKMKVEYERIRNVVQVR